MSQELAQAGVDRSYMGGIERGEHNMTIINLLRIGAVSKSLSGDYCTTGRRMALVGRAFREKSALARRRNSRKPTAACRCSAQVNPKPTGRSGESLIQSFIDRIDGVRQAAGDTRITVPATPPKPPERIGPSNGGHTRERNPRRTARPGEYRRHGEEANHLLGTRSDCGQ